MTWASLSSKTPVRGSEYNQPRKPLPSKQKLKGCFQEMPTETLGISIAALGPRKQTSAQNGNRHILSFLWQNIVIVESGKTAKDLQRCSVGQLRRSTPRRYQHLQQHQDPSLNFCGW